MNCRLALHVWVFMFQPRKPDIAAHVSAEEATTMGFGVEKVTIWERGGGVGDGWGEEVAE